MASSLCAQNLMFGEEDEVELPKDRTDFCSPGVINKSRGRGILLERRSVGAQHLAPNIGDIDGANASDIARVERIKGKIKIPLVNAADLKVLMGYEYARETFRFNRIGYYNEEVFRSLHDNPLHTNKYSIYITKSFNDKYYAGLRVRTSYRGDHEEMINFDGRYATYSALAAFGIKPREDLEYGFGLTYSRGFFNTNLLPFGIYNQTFNKKWGIETVLPVRIMMRYNFTPKELLLFGVEFQSKSYSIDVYRQSKRNLPPTPYYFRHAEIAWKATYDKHLFSWIWFTAEAGYQIPLNSRFDNTQDATLNFRTRATPQPFFNIGVFVSPSRDCVK
ncbi:MAG: hypothetical protein GVY26_09010 [Bacteroidetes bacterium]|nr:hypothetical protein [Bacteroidota bacterium]